MVATGMPRPFTITSDPARGGCRGSALTWRALAGVLGALWRRDVGPFGFSAGAVGSALASAGAGYTIPGSLIGAGGLAAVVCAATTVVAVQRTIQVSPRTRRECIIETSRSSLGRIAGPWSARTLFEPLSFRSCARHSHPDQRCALNGSGGRSATQ